MPIKRNENIVPLSQDHHLSLLFGWKIRQGVKADIDVNRIVDYVHYFEDVHLLPHFKEEEDYFYFIVSNSGDKISDEVASKIFNPFFSTKHTGTGLGLSISQTIMKDHGGELYLDTNNYSNTTFVVKHPIESFLH